MTLVLRFSNSGFKRATSPSSVVQTGVKSLGWENRMPQPLPRYSWNLILPSVESCSKSGAVSPSRRAMISSFCRLFETIFCWCRLFAGGAQMSQWTCQFRARVISVVLQRGHLRPCVLDRGEIDLAGNDAGLVAGFGDDLAPGRDDQRMAIGLAAAGMLAALRGRQDKGAGFNRAGTQQHMPMRPAGRHGEGGGDTDHRRTGLGEVAVEMREAQVVADRHPERTPRCRRDDGLGTRANAFGFAIGLAVRQIDVEQ